MSLPDDLQIRAQIRHQIDRAVLEVRSFRLRFKVVAFRDIHRLMVMVLHVSAKLLSQHYGPPLLIESRNMKLAGKELHVVFLPDQLRQCMNWCS